MSDLKFEEKSRLKMKLFFAWFDFWVGLYFDRNKKILYLCPLPMFCISFHIEKVKLCPACRLPMCKMAHNTGDGWLLHWGCDYEECDNFYIDYNDNDYLFEWPFEKETATAKDFEAVGFLVV